MKVTLTKEDRQMVNCRKHETAIVDLPTEIGQGTVLWHWVHVREGARIGRDCSFGQGCYIDTGVVIGDRVRVQNHVSIYKGVIIEDDVFIAPSVVFTNVRKPRAGVPVSPDQYDTTVVKRGATICANATIICGVTIGEGAMVGAGAVVNKNVPPYTLVVGSPARVIKTLPQE